jgi:hypothetical protein
MFCVIYKFAVKPATKMNSAIVGLLSSNGTIETPEALGLAYTVPALASLSPMTNCRYVSSGNSKPPGQMLNCKLIARLCGSVYRGQDALQAGNNR